MRFHDSELGNPDFSKTNEKDVDRALAPGANPRVNWVYTVKINWILGTII